MNRVVIVTGGTRGIGLETAKTFLNNGDKVVVASIDSPQVIEQAMSELKAIGDVIFMECNIADPAQCKYAVEQAVEQYGQLDVVANVAGVVGKREELIEADLDDIFNTININLMGTINLGKFAGKAMVEKKSGVIINVGSICGTIANTENMGYHASKGGVKMVTQALARELSPHGIRVLSVAPGWVNTDMIDAPIAEIGGKLHMKGRIIEPTEIANAIYLMSLPEASAINGTTVMVDDGYSAFKGVDGYQA